MRVVQPRARATRDALLSAGRALLVDRDFDAMSIADLAGAIGLSVGSFYGRFQDKEAFFAQLQAQVMDEWLDIARATLAAMQADGRGPEQLVGGICRLYIGRLREDRGFVRAALKHASTHPGSWNPVQRTGEMFVDEVVELLTPRLTHLPPAQRAARVRFAMQMMLGVGVNAVLNDPGPLRLDDRRFERELGRGLARYLELGGAARLVPVHGPRGMRAPRGAPRSPRR